MVPDRCGPIEALIGLARTKIMQSQDPVETRRALLWYLAKWDSWDRVSVGRGNNTTTFRPVDSDSDHCIVEDDSWNVLITEWNGCLSPTQCRDFALCLLKAAALAETWASQNVSRNSRPPVQG